MQIPVNDTRENDLYVLPRDSKRDWRIFCQIWHQRCKSLDISRTFNGKFATWHSLSRWSRVSAWFPCIENAPPCAAMTVSAPFRFGTQSAIAMWSNRELTRLKVSKSANFCRECRLKWRSIFETCSSVQFLWCCFISQTIRYRALKPV